MKTYCVHIYPRMLEYENIKAKTPAQALREVLLLEWPDEAEEIGSTEVMLTCRHCDTDNDCDNKTCEECGKKL